MEKELNLHRIILAFTWLVYLYADFGVSDLTNTRAKSLAAN